MDKRVVKLYKEDLEEKDIRSMELFNKHFYELNNEESIKLNQYIYDLKNPIWKKIDYSWMKNRYSISNIGYIRNDITMKILKLKINRSGYNYVNISVDGDYRTLTIHRLVAIAFIPNPENKPMVNHMNGKKTCNWVGNLEWNTAKENTQHAIINGLSSSIGVSNHNNKYDESQIRTVCYLLQQNHTPMEIYELINVSPNVSDKIKNGKQWTHISQNYNIPKPINRKRPDDLKLYMEELIWAGYSNKEIVQLTGLPDTKFELEYVGLFRRRLLKRSSTIDQLH